MTAKAEDDALSWAGDTDPTHVDAPVAHPLTASPTSAAVSTPTTEPTPIPEPKPGKQPMSSVLLVTLGILGGVYLLYTVGWFVSFQRTTDFSLTPFDQIMFNLREYLSIAAAAMWYGATLLLTRRQKPIVGLLWLVLGVVVLVPWPFVMGR